MKTVLTYLILIVTLIFFNSCANKKIDNLKEGKAIFDAADKTGKNENRKEEFRIAIRYFKAELNDNPNSFETQIYLSEAYGRLSEPDSAILVLNRAIEFHNKETAHLFAARGVEYLNKHDYENSVGSFEEALKYDTNDRQLYKMIVQSKLKQRYYINGAWLNFDKGDLANIINEVYPADYKNKPSVDEFINDLKTYTYQNISK